jgi:hypothetical protein
MYVKYTNRIRCDEVGYAYQSQGNGRKMEKMGMEWPKNRDVTVSKCVVFLAHHLFTG